MANSITLPPEPVALTDEEIDDKFFEHCYTDDFGNELMERQQFRKGARAVLARAVLARRGTPANNTSQAH